MTWWEISINDIKGFDNTIIIHTDSYLLDDQPALPANTTTVVQGHPCCAPECITDKVLDRHVCKGETLWADFLQLFLQNYWFIGVKGDRKAGKKVMNVHTVTIF